MLFFSETCLSRKISTPSSREPVISPATLHTVLKRVQGEEDRCRNVFLFGLPEEDGEKLKGMVGDVLQTIGQKPAVEAGTESAELNVEVKLDQLANQSK